MNDIKFFKIVPSELDRFPTFFQEILKWILMNNFWNNI